MRRRTDLTVNELIEILNGGNNHGCNQYGCKAGTGKGTSAKGTRSVRLTQDMLKKKYPKIKGTGKGGRITASDMKWEEAGIAAAKFSKTKAGVAGKKSRQRWKALDRKKAREQAAYDKSYVGWR
jgi:hypothetical protein